VPKPPKNEGDLERYETELNDFRRQLEDDRNKLNKEVETLRERNNELEEAIREVEMEMSKERAELAANGCGSNESARKSRPTRNGCSARSPSAIRWPPCKNSATRSLANKPAPKVKAGMRSMSGS